jgi:hypothetical protein
MNKRILTICLALALCLSLIPAAAFAEAPLYTYQEIATGIKATDISMMDNGYGSFKVYDNDLVLVSKGVVSPSGKTVLTRVPGPDEPHGDTVDASTIYDATGSVIADLLPVYDGPAETMMGADYDFNLYGTDGKLITSAKKIIASYEKMSVEDIVCSMTAYFGRDGYLTVFAYLDGVNVYAYIIDPQTQKVVHKQWCYEDTPRVGGDIWKITSVNDGLISYSHISGARGEYAAAGWMDINGNHKLSVDPDKYFDWYNFSSGVAQVANPTGMIYGYVDKTGKEVIPCIYFRASMFKNGYAYVAGDDEKYGYIDTAGKTVIPFEYDGAYGYGEGLFAVGVKDGDTCKYGLVDEDNNEVVPRTYDDISYVRDNTAYAIEDGELVILQFDSAGPTISRTMEKANGNVSNFEIDLGRKTVTVQGSQSGSEPVLIASYDEDGRFLGVKAVTEDEGKVSFERGSETLLLLATDSKLQPMAEAIEVDLTAPVDDVAAQ